MTETTNPEDKRARLDSSSSEKPLAGYEKELIALSATPLGKNARFQQICEIFGNLGTQSGHLGEP